MNLLYWIGRNLPAVLAFGMAIWAGVAGYYVQSLFFLVMVHTFAIHQTLYEIRERLDAMKDADS